MGNIKYKNDSWFINEEDQIKPGEMIEVKIQEDQWAIFEIKREFGEMYRDQRSGRALNHQMVVRRVMN